MKKDKLIELYSLLKNNNIKVNSDSIKNLSDSDVDMILYLNKYPDLTIKLFNNSNFKKLDERSKYAYIDCLDECVDKDVANIVCNIILNDKIFNSGRLYSIVNFVVKNNIEKAKYIEKLLECDDLLNSKKLIDYLFILTFSNDNEAFAIYKLMTNKQIINTDYFDEIGSLIQNNNREKEINDLIACVACDNNIINTGKVLEICNIISYSKGYDQAIVAYSFISNNIEVLNHDNLLLFMSIICNAKGKDQAIQASYVIDCLLNDESVILYANKIANCENNYQSIYGREIILYEKTPIKFKKELFNIITNSKGYDQARYATNIALMSKYKKNKYYLEIVKTIAEANSIDKARFSVIFLSLFNKIDDKIMNYFRIINNLSDKKIDYLDYYSRFVLEYLNDKDKFRYLDILNNASSFEEISNLYDNVFYMLEKKDNINKVDRNSDNEIEMVDFNNKEYEFWSLFNESPEDAIELLNNNVDNNIELEDDLVIKKKLKQ